MMFFRVLNWNVGGAKYLEIREEKKKIEFRKALNDALNGLIEKYEPHVVALQEVVEYNKPNEYKKNIINPPSGYVYSPCILIDTERHPYVSKWRKVQQKGNWPDGSYFGQGNGMLWREDSLHFPVWSLPKIGILPDSNPHVHDGILMSGLYFGDRNTEPRAALVSHFMVDEDDEKKKKLKKPFDVFVVNIHLTTLMKEREGIPEIDEKASKIRLAQLDTILDGIVSCYNDWGRGGYRFRGERRKPDKNEQFNRYSPIWILCGDFNFTPESLEYERLKRMNFVDLNPVKGKGTKGKGFGSQATITCDYIFAGPKYISLDSLIIGDSVRGNPPPDYAMKVSDHYPLFAEIPLTLL